MEKLRLLVYVLMLVTLKSLTAIGKEIPNCVEIRDTVSREALVSQSENTTLLNGVVCGEDGTPLPGTSVYIKGSTVGTASNIKGEFKLSVPSKKENTTLIFRFVGMETRELKLSDIRDPDILSGKKGLKVIMRESKNEIDEVVVTGYQEINSDAVTGDYTVVKGEDLIMTGTETLESMLQGKVPGMVVTNPNGLVGTRQKIRVRGTTSLLGDSEPLWVVDGIIQDDPLPVEPSSLAGMDAQVDMMKDFIGSAVSWLNPNDIESITVLKDAATTALYGVRAANGVIVIKTKKGKKDRLSLSYNTSLSMSKRMNYKKQDVMNSKERIALSREGWERGSTFSDEGFGFGALARAYYVDRTMGYEEFNAEVKRLETVNTNWFDILYQVPFSQSHNLSFSGGGENGTYYGSVGYRNVRNTAKGNEQMGVTGNMKVNLRFWEKLQLAFSLSGSRTETSAFASSVSPFDYAIKTSRIVPCYDENSKDGLYYYYRSGEIYKYNILNELSHSGNENVLNNVNLSMNVNWRPVEPFAVVFTAGLATSSSDARMWYTEHTNYITQLRGVELSERNVTDSVLLGSQLPFGGLLKNNVTKGRSYSLRLQPEFTKNFNGVHFLSVVAGMEMRSAATDGHSHTSYGYMPERGETFVQVPPTIVSGNGGVQQNPLLKNGGTRVTKSLGNSMGYYASMNYMYDNRYSASLSVRGDGSNAFGREGKFLPIWSFGLRWNVSKENWFDKIDKFISNLSLSANGGYQGSVVPSVSPKLVAKISAVDLVTGEFRMNWVELPKPELRWEKTFSVNLGVRFGLFDDKINGNFSWYYRRTEDLITSKKIPYEYGTTSMYLNSGDMNNKGWNLGLTVIPIRTKDFMWSLSTNFSSNRNRLRSSVKENGKWMDAVRGNFNKEGYPVGAFWAFRFTGLSPKHGGPQFDFRGTGTKAAEEDATNFMQYMGTREPKFTLGLNTVLRWRRFSIPLNFYISRGNYEFLDSPYRNSLGMPSEYENVSNELNKRWRKPGDEKFTNIPSVPTRENAYIMYPFGDDQTILPLDAWRYSTVRVVKAWFMRFQDFRFSYNLPEKWIKGIVRSVRVSATATNPLIIKSRDFKGKDPEVALGNQPRSENYSLSLSVEF